MLNISMDFDSCEPAERSAYADYEVVCPFCECNYLNIQFEEGNTKYKCNNCGGEWNVLER